MTRLDPRYPLCVYYEYVPQPSAWTRAYLHICSCTLWISNLYAHDPHHMHISSRLSIMPICQLCIVEMRMTMTVLLVEIVWPIIVEIVCIWHFIVEIKFHSSRLDLLVLIIVEIHVSVNYKDSYYLYILWDLCGFCDQKIRLWVDKLRSLCYAR